MDDRFAEVFRGTRILDLSRLLTGPYASTMFAELGAEVIKVENPDGGDETRGFPPFAKGTSLYFSQLNHSRRSVAINLKHPEGPEVVARLAASSDVVVENFLPGTADTLGVGYEQLSAGNPRLVYCSASGFGQDGPFRRRKAYDSLMQAIGGLTAATGEPDGPPVKAGLPASDIGTAMFGAFAIASALFQREKTGRGQHVDVNMFESLVAMMSVYAVDYINTGRLLERVGTRHRYRVPSGVFTCRDGTLLHITMGEPQWPSFCRAVGHPEWLDNPSFATPAARVEHREEVEREVVEALAVRTAQQWYEVLDSAGVPCGPVNTFAEVFAHPQLVHAGTVESVRNPLPDEDDLNFIRMPYRFDHRRSHIRTAAPALGEHTDELLRDIAGYTADEISRLRSAGAVA